MTDIVEVDDLKSNNLLVCEMEIGSYINFFNYTNYYELWFGTHLKCIYNLMYIIKLNSSLLVDVCVDLIIYDHPSKNNRFTLIYSILSTVYNYRTYIFIQVNELVPVVSLSQLFSNLIWSEREGWDIFGVFFINNTDLRRILTDYGFKGHPLRKDFPLTGFYEISYNDTLQQIQHSRVELTQEFRVFTFDFNNKLCKKLKKLLPCI